MNVNAGGSFTMTNGSIVGNTATNGGGVFVGNNSAYFLMKNGSISGNSATNGGGVFVGNESASFIMTGGSIAGNTAASNGGVSFANAGSLTLGGTAAIFGNTAGTGDSAVTQNLYLAAGKTIALGTGADAPVSMYIGVTTATGINAGSIVSFTTAATAADIKHFFPDDKSLFVTYDNGALALAKPALTAVALNVTKGIQYPTLAAALSGAAAYDEVKLLNDYSGGTDGKENVTIPEGVFLDLNHHAFDTDGTITNNGTIILYQENAGIIDGLLFAVSGAYSTGEELKLYDNQITIPDGAFFTNEISTEGTRHQELDFAIFDDAQSLVWNMHAPAGVQLSVTYALTLGGDIPSVSGASTAVTANKVTLSNNITIGSNNSGDGEAALVIESIHYDEDDPYYGEDVIGRFIPNGKTITINETGKLIVSSDIVSDVVFDSSVLVSGVDGKTVYSQEDTANKTTTYSLNPPPAPASYSDPTVTVPVSGEENTVNVEATVSGHTATIKDISDEEIEKVVGGEGKTGIVEIDLSGLNKNIDTAVLKTSTVEKIAEAIDDKGENGGMVIKMPEATVEFDATATTAIAEQAEGSELKIVVDNKETTMLNNVQQAAVSAMDVRACFGAEIMSGGTRIGTFLGGSVTVTIEADVKSGENVNAFKGFCIKHDGGVEVMQTKVEVGRAQILMPHFSDYVVVYDETYGAYDNCPKDTTCPASKFTDVDVTAWYHDGVHFCVENGIMKGVSDTKFDTTGDITRAQIVTMLWRLDGEKYANYAMTFQDVPAEQWYTEAVRWAASEKIVNGYDAEHYGPEDPITREQMATILYNYAKYKGQGFIGSWMFLLDFVDRADISEWADEAVHWCSMKGVVTGKDGKVFDPQGTATRAEAATMVQRFCEALEK